MLGLATLEARDQRYERVRRDVVIFRHWPDLESSTHGSSGDDAATHYLLRSAQIRRCRKDDADADADVDGVLVPEGQSSTSRSWRVGDRYGESYEVPNRTGMGYGCPFDDMMTSSRKMRCIARYDICRYAIHAAYIHDTRHVVHLSYTRYLAKP